MWIKYSRNCPKMIVRIMFGQLYSIVGFVGIIESCYRWMQPERLKELQ